jgi:hypothetical protein
MSGDRQEHHDRSALALERELVVAAAAATHEVTPEVAAPQRRAGESGELLADVVARGLAREARGDERVARLENERLDLLSGHPQYARDLLVLESAELSEDQRRPLVLGQRADIAQEVTQRLAALNCGDETLCDRLRRIAVHDRRIAPPRPQHRDTAVARDREQPRLEVDRLSAVTDATVGGEEGVLDCVVGIVGLPEEVPAEGVDRAGVAVVDLLERPRIAFPNPRHEPLVGNDITLESPRHHPWRGSTHDPSIARAPDVSPPL